MAKKRIQKNWKHYIRQPVQIKHILPMIAVAASFAGVNLAAFLKTPPRIQAVPAVVTQSDLMNVLGTTVQLGEQNTNDYTAFFQKPEIQYWQNIAREKQDYQDAHVMLAIYAYNVHNCQLAKSFITTAVSLDVTDRQVWNVKKTIDRCGV